jgi:Na+/H+ antiporter NhaC
MDFYGWLGSMGNGIMSMGELIIITMMAGGLLEMIKANGGIDYLIQKMTSHVNSKKGAELSVSALVCFVNICTANNTVAILTVGGIVKEIGDRYGLDNRKCASILDTVSCCIQGLLPYGAQLLMAAGLAAVSPIEFLPYLYYSVGIGFAVILSVIFRYPKRYST